jgi:hypothetical protein
MGQQGEQYVVLFTQCKITQLKKEWSCDTHDKVNHETYAKEKRPVTKDHMLCDSVLSNVQNRQSPRRQKAEGGHQDLREGRRGVSANGGEEPVTV